MVKLSPVNVDDLTAVAVEVDLPATHLVAVSTGRGYVMCGALDVRLLDERLASRRIVAARVVGIKTVDELLAGAVDDCTAAARELGVRVGMTGRDALRLMA